MRMLFFCLAVIGCSSSPVADSEDFRRNPYDTGNQIERKEQCPQEKIRCPDGRWVGRDPANNCQFELCE
ncbi:MAG: hypothetical protein CVV45_16150 [Spirochaetae bacterium HGW-Spirochaetae-10]|mgnify:FL=1|nr:MAG: hypothetical protein CVV45_16150 [Spirochaetae bacterium HGW-Spirochaetae-10]